VCADERLVVAAFDAALIIVKKHVINDSGGSDATKTAGSFQLQVQTPTGGARTGGRCGGEAGERLQLPRRAAYNVVELTDPAPTYTLTYPAECTGTILAGDVKTCTVTNDDIPPAKLTVIKHVINDSGGSDATKTAGSFQLQVQTPTGGA